MAGSFISRLDLISLVVCTFCVTVLYFNSFFDGRVEVGSSHLLEEYSLPEAVLLLWTPFYLLMMFHYFFCYYVVSRITRLFW